MVLIEFGWLTKYNVFLVRLVKKKRATFGRRQCIQFNYDWYIKNVGPQGKNKEKKNIHTEKWSEV